MQTDLDRRSEAEAVTEIRLLRRHNAGQQERLSLSYFECCIQRNSASKCEERSRFRRFDKDRDRVDSGKR